VQITEKGDLDDEVIIRLILVTGARRAGAVRVPIRVSTPSTRCVPPSRADARVPPR
jgi:hypothetical protein